jgi:7-carboxy-7-deazaguanine synthase
MKYKIAETFTSIQGEGHLAGTKMHFIRFAGCTVTQCKLHPANSGLCDTDWSPKLTPSIKNLTLDAFDAVGSGGWVSITGGEPADQPEFLCDLTNALDKLGLKINIQTSGTKRFTGHVDFLTVSPKTSVKDIALTCGHEMKLLYMGQTQDELADWIDSTDFDHYFLMPLWRDGSANVAETIQAVHASNDRWRLALQTHKWAGIR